MVSDMQAEPQLDAAFDELLHPAYWLVMGLEWQGDGAMAEAAVAVAPGIIPRDSVGHDLGQVLGCANLYAQRRGRRVIFFSDLTRMFADVGTSWSQLGVDWQKALQDLQHSRFPAMYLTISRRAHALICNPASRPLMTTPTGSEDTTEERELVRQAITRQLANDWAPYMQSIMDAGRIRQTG
jgi:hypothetical protein